MNQIESLKALVEKTEGDEQAKYQDELVKAIQEDAEAKANAKVDEKVREELAKNTQENIEVKSPKIEMGTGDKHKGVQIKKVMAKMAEKASARGASDYMNADPERGEFVARFWIDKTMEAQGQTKANELVTTTDGVGGYLTPTEQEEAILHYVRLTSVALQKATVVPMVSDVMTHPVGGTGANVTIESGETSITQATPTFTIATLTSKRHSGYVPVSWELEADNTAGLVSYLADSFYEDLGKEIDSAVFLGPGTLVDGSGVMVGYGKSATLASAAFTSVTGAKVYETIGKLAPRFRAGADCFVGFENAWTYLPTLAAMPSGTEVPIWDKMSGKISGFPLVELEQAQASGSGNTLLTIGNLKNFLIGSRLMNTQLKRIEEKTGLTNYVFFTRLAYANPLPNAFSSLVGA
jgi:HK97 family phage major capsid protein